MEDFNTKNLWEDHENTSHKVEIGKSYLLVKDIKDCYEHSETDECAIYVCKGLSKNGPIMVSKFENDNWRVTVQTHKVVNSGRILTEVYFPKKDSLLSKILSKFVKEKNSDRSHCK